MQDGIPSGGAFSGTYTSGNLFATTQAGVGKHTVVYQFTDSTGYKDTAHAQIEVHALPVVDFRPVTPRCANAASFVLNTGTPEGGSYKQSGNVNSSFNPADYGFGLHQVFYNYTDSNSCSNSKLIYVTLHTSPEVNLDLDTSFCEGAAPYQLIGSQSGGSYSGSGVSFGGFFTDSEGAGIHEITYSRTDSVNFCSDSTKDSIEVVALPAKPVITRNANILYASSGYIYEWFNAQGTSRSSDSSFVPGADGNYYLVVTTETRCVSESSDTLKFTILGLELISSPNPWRLVQPLSGEIHLVSMASKEMSFSVFSMEGKLQGKISLDSRGEASMSLLPGIYLFREDESALAKSVVVY